MLARRHGDIRLSGFVFGCLLCTLLSAASPAAANVTYSRLDLATVRVFAYSGVELADAMSKKTKKRYKVATPAAGHGSGILVSADGMVLTAQHVIDGASNIVVMMPGSLKAYPAVVAYQSKKLDVAVLSIPSTQETFVPLPDTPPTLQVRSTIFAVGYPLFADRKHPQSSRGAISGVMPDGKLQLSVSINPGNSGGPLVDEAENLIGIVVARGNPEQGIEGLGVAVGLDQILPKRETFVKLHADAKRQLERATSVTWTTASVIARLVQSHSDIAMIGDAVRGFYGSKPKIEEELESALQKGDDATLRALACAYHWNAAIVFRDGGSDGWQKHAKLATKHCEGARKLDPALERQSSFVAFVVGSPAPSYRLENSSSGNGGVSAGSGPENLGVFRLGMTVDQARSACESHDFTFREVQNRFECSRAPDAPFSGVARLRFSEGSLQRIDVVRKLDPKVQADWSEEYNRRRSSLEKTYGKATSVRHEFPDVCQRHLRDCVQKGTAMFEHAWSFRDNGRRLSVALGRYDDGAAVVLSLKTAATQ